MLWRIEIVKRNLLFPLTTHQQTSHNLHVQIIRKYPKRSLNDFIGDENYAALEMRMMNKNPTPHYGDVKNLLRSFVLGMGPLDLPKVKSLCIAGPPKCGKKFLVEALCTDMDAVMFDLSPIIIASIQDLKECLALVMQMAKKLQPSVIFIDGAHKPFIKTITDQEKTEIPRKLGFFLLKSVVKKLTNEDAVMLISTTNQPFNCNFWQTKTVLWENCYVSANARLRNSFDGLEQGTWTQKDL